MLPKSVFFTLKLIGPRSEGDLYAACSEITCRRFSASHRRAQLSPRKWKTTTTREKKRVAASRPLGGAVELIRDLTEVREPVGGATWGSMTAAAEDFQVASPLKYAEPLEF